MGTLTLEEVRSLGDPAKAYKWTVKLPTIGDNSKGIIDSGEKLFDKQKLSGLDAQNLLRGASSILNGNIPLNKTALKSFDASNYVEEVQNLVFPSCDREAFYRGGRNTYYPGLEDTQPFTIVFYQDESERVQKYILDWKRLVRNLDGTVNYPKAYKKPIVVNLVNGLNVTIFTVRLVGCFPTQTAPYNLSNSSERLILTQEFSMDRLEIVDISADQIIAETATSRIKKILPRQLNDLDNLVSKGDIDKGVQKIR